MLNKLQQLDYNALPISTYSRDYILRMLPHLGYYLSIYNRLLDKVISRHGNDPSKIILVDYGGGHGFLSITAKQRGIGTVIYVDYNPKAAETVACLSKEVGFGPDAIVVGDAKTLQQWCLDHHTTPNILMGMDVIEHIYRLDTFFSDLFAINPRLEMIFTTGSTPYNPLVVKRLHRIMLRDELGHDQVKGFREIRRTAIAQHYPAMDNETLNYWAENTRGMTIADTLKAVERQKPFTVNDPYNTCDPETGSWTERILPIEEYQRLLNTHHASLQVTGGQYNATRKNLKGLLARLINPLTRLKAFRAVAPYITLFINMQ